MYLEFVLIDLIALAILIYAWRVLPAGKIRWLFIVAFLLMTVYKVYDPVSDSRELLWYRHLPVYIGEVYFYLFITKFSKRYIEIEDSPTKPHSVVVRQNLFILAPLITFATGFSWYQFVTDQGLQHILTLPLFVLVLSMVRLRLAVYDNKYIKIVKLFTIAASGWILMHVSEFIIESQQLIPKLSDNMPHVEFFWYCIGAFMFWYSLKIFNDMQNEKDS